MIVCFCIVYYILLLHLLSFYITYFITIRRNCWNTFYNHVHAENFKNMNDYTSGVLSELYHILLIHAYIYA